MFVAVVFVVLAVLAFFGAIILREPDEATNFSPAAWLAGLALWFHLVSQIIHIRANTQK
jgi:choline-glycine betaine transporter